MDDETKEKLCRAVEEHCRQNQGIFSSDDLDRIMLALGIIERIPSKGTHRRASLYYTRAAARDAIRQWADREGMAIYRVSNASPKQSLPAKWRLDDSMVIGMKRLGNQPEEDLKRQSRRLDLALKAIANVTSHYAQAYGFPQEDVEYIRGKAMRAYKFQAVELQTELERWARQKSLSWPRPLKDVVPLAPPEVIEIASARKRRAKG